MDGDCWVATDISNRESGTFNWHDGAGVTKPAEEVPVGWAKLSLPIVLHDLGIPQRSTEDRSPASSGNGAEGLEAIILSIKFASKWP